MWTGEVKSTELFSANRWTVSFFNTDVSSLMSCFPMRPVGDVACERRGSADPQQMGTVRINYLGLENIRPLTGELIDFSPRPAASVKSRSKVFMKEDVLYGRLRPELNKVYLAQGEVPEGLCSGEFIVLVPRQEKILPRYLRHVLASAYVTAFSSKLKMGASLPRMAAEDLLGIKIPIPPLEDQETLVKKLETVDLEIAHLRRQLNDLPSKASNDLLHFLLKGNKTDKAAR